MSKTQNIALALLLPTCVGSVVGSVYYVRNVYNKTCNQAYYDTLYKKGFNEALKNEDEQKEEYESLRVTRLNIEKETNELSLKIDSVKNEINDLNSKIAELDFENNQSALASLLAEKEQKQSNLSKLEQDLNEYKTLYESLKVEGSYLVTYVVEGKINKIVVIQPEESISNYVIENTSKRRFNGWKDSQGQLVDPTQNTNREDITYIADFTYAYDVTFVYRDIPGNNYNSTITYWENDIIVAPTPIRDSEYVSQDYISGWVVQGTRDFVDLTTYTLNQNVVFEYIDKMTTWNVTKKNFIKGHSINGGKSISIAYTLSLPYVSDQLRLQYATKIETKITLDMRRYEFSKPVENLYKDTLDLEFLSIDNGVFKAIAQCQEDVLVITLKMDSDNNFIFSFENSTNTRHLPYELILDSMQIAYR